jgi:hypothetical protein
VGKAVANKGLRIDLLEVGIGGLVVDALLQIDNDAGWLAVLGEGIAVHAHALGARELGPNAVGIEREGVVARLGHFALVRVAREVALVRGLLAALVGLERAGVGHDEHIAEVGAARTAEVSVRKAREQTIGIMVARAPVPALEYILRPQLHRPKRHVGPQKYVAVAAGPDERVDVGGERRGLGAGRAGRSQQQAGDQPPPGGKGSVHT